MMTKSDWSKSVQLRAAGAPIDVTGWSFEWVMRRSRTSSDALVALTGAPGIVIDDAAEGRLTISLTAAQTAALGAGDRPFALYRTDGGRRLALVSGKAVVHEGV